MTEQCKHEWRITCVWSDEYKMNVPKVYCRIGDCGEELPIENALARLNDAERLEETNKGLFNIIKVYHPAYIDGCECPQCSDMPIYFDTLEGKP